MMLNNRRRIWGFGCVLQDFRRGATEAPRLATTHLPNFPFPLRYFLDHAPNDWKDDGFNELHRFLESIARLPGMGILPRRGRTDQPRATPWDLEVKPTSSPERAGHGPSDVSPFQGSGIDIRPDPRALPWADLWLPLRGDRQRCRYRCYSLLLSQRFRASTGSPLM